MFGKLPFPHWIKNTDLQVYKTYLNEDGEPVEELLFNGKAFYEERSRQVLDSQRRLVMLSGKVIIEGEINKEPFEGFVKVGSVKKTIFRSLKPKNPDGSIFSTEIDLS